VTLDLALFALRGAVGGLAMFVSFRGVGFALASRPGRSWVVLVIACEALGGILTVLGLGGPIGPGMVAEIVTVVVIVAEVPRGLWDDGERLGWHFPALRAMSTMPPERWHLLITVSALVIAILGNGAWALDRTVELTFSAWLRIAWLVFLAVSALLVGIVRVAVERAIAKE
jgi:uncharacterized membrane protein YphA (DoxX/SURF4 family)